MTSIVTSNKPKPETPTATTAAGPAPDDRADVEELDALALRPADKQLPGHDAKRLAGDARRALSGLASEHKSAQAIALLSKLPTADFKQEMRRWATDGQLERLVAGVSAEQRQVLAQMLVTKAAVCCHVDDAPADRVGPKAPQGARAVWMEREGVEQLSRCGAQRGPARGALKMTMTLRRCEGRRASQHGPVAARRVERC